MSIAFQACKTTKKKGEMGWVGKQYHDITARFNGYYNADVIYEESYASLEQSYPENYTQILPVYPAITIDNPETEAANLDKAIEKVATVANLHPGSKWIDDCYVMMGKSQYLKQDYESAEETLKYFQDNFNPADPNSKAFNTGKKDAKKERQNQIKEDRKTREIARKKADEEREDENRLKAKLKEAEGKIKSKVRGIKDSKKEFIADRKKDYDDLRKNLKEQTAKVKTDNKKSEEKLREEIKDLKSDLVKVSKKERETERDRRLKERQKSKKEGSRSERRRKEPKKEGTAGQKEVVVVNASDQIRQQIEAKEAALIALKERNTEQEAQLKTSSAQQLDEFKQQSEKLETEYDEQATNVVEQAEKDKEQKAQEKERQEQEAIAAEQAAADAALEEANSPKEDKIKTRDNLGKAGFLKHRPAYAEGIYWLSMTYIERQNFYLAEYLLNTLNENPDISKELAKRLPAANAHLYLAQERYEKAVPELERAIGRAKKKKEKARYAFILAQLLEKRGQFAEASAAYKRSKDMSRDYEMKFNSELAMIRTSWSSGLASMDKVQKQLKKMSKDEKNIDYLDQIYYAKAELKLADGDEEGAMADFKEAATYGGANSARQAESYYRLASLFYSSDDYINAKTYYDSTLQVMPEKDDRYVDVKNLNDNLSSIAQNAGIVETQDSLLMLGNMDKAALNKWAEERYDAQVAATAPPEAGEPEPIKPTLSSAVKGNQLKNTFFAYNPLILQKGKFDFQRKWGSRPVADNWRRGAVVGEFTLDEDIEDIAEQASESERQKAIDEILREVPTTSAQKRVANEKLQTALFSLGTDLRNNLGNYAKSNDRLVEFIERYPNSDQLLNVYYYLYLNNQELGNEAGANIYLNLIKSEFPDSDFAKALVNPAYAEEMETDKKKLLNYYDTTYSTFERGEYQTTIDRVKEAETLFGKDNEYIVKFDLLSVMSTGAIQGKPFYIKGLKDFIARHPNTAETTRANEILRFLKGDEEAFNKELNEEKLANFKRQDEKLHYIIIVLYDLESDEMKQAKVAVSGYNQKFHKLAKLRLSNIYLNTETKSQIMLIRSFENKEKAQSYIQIAKRNLKDHLDPDSYQYDVFSATTNNYREIMKQKTTKNYESFYDIHYRE